MISVLKWCQRILKVRYVLRGPYVCWFVRYWEWTSSSANWTVPNLSVCWYTFWSVQNTAMLCSLIKPFLNVQSVGIYMAFWSVKKHCNVVLFDLNVQSVGIYLAFWSVENTAASCYFRWRQSCKEFIDSRDWSSWSMGKRVSVCVCGWGGGSGGRQEG